jgi:hypothetical protein
MTQRRENLAGPGGGLDGRRNDSGDFEEIRKATSSRVGAQQRQEEERVQEKMAKAKPRRRKAAKSDDVMPRGASHPASLFPAASPLRIALPFIGIFLTMVLCAVKHGPQWISSSSPDVDFVSKALLNEFPAYPATAIDDEVPVLLTLAVHRIR